MTDTELTLAAIAAHGWEVVQLGPRAKRPMGSRWQITKDPATAEAWLTAGSNLGLVCHQRTGVLVLDPDDGLAFADMIEALGQPCLPWVITGSGRLHYYVQWEPDLPAKLMWQGKTIGEIQRGPGQQQIVIPPSIHPQTGLSYKWITERLGFLVEPIDPVREPLPELPGEWRAFLRGQSYAHSRA